MDRHDTDILGISYALAAGLTWFVSGVDGGVPILSTLLAAATIVAAWSEFGRPYLALALGEACAVALGLATPVLGILVQPAIAALVASTDDIHGFLAVSVVMIAASGTILFLRHTLVPLLALIGIVVLVALGVLGVETWIRRRLAGGTA